MKFQKLRKALERLIFTHKFFYDEVSFDDNLVRKRTQKVITAWIDNLNKYKNIRIKKFKDLFKECEEVVFPIRIMNSYGSNSMRIEFLDSKGNKYSIMSMENIYAFHTMTEYIIERRNTLEPMLDREFCYIISSDNTISLIETTAMKLKENGKNDDLAISFRYNMAENMTEVELKNYSISSKIKIKYGTSGHEFENEVMEFLFSIKKDEYCKIIRVLEWLYDNMKESETSTFSIISEVDEKIFSEIDIVGGRVKYYMTTKIISEEKTEINKKICDKEITTFLKDNAS